MAGRWELSSDQADFFLAKLEQRSGMIQPEETVYLQQLTFASIVQEEFSHSGPLRAGDIHAVVLSDRAPTRQVYYAGVQGLSGTQVIGGLAVEPQFVEQVLRDAAAALAIGDDIDVGIEAARDPSTGRDVIRIAFPDSLAFWNLAIAPATPGGALAAARRELLIFAGSTILVLGVLGFGVFLLIRDSARDLQLARLRANFVSGVSHELKTPLTLIRLYGETLLHGKNLPADEKSGFYEIITRESERLTHLIEKVLDFARVDRGQRAYSLQAGDLYPVVSRTVEGYTQYLERRGFSISSSLQDDLPTVRFDADAVSQAMVNLIDNALKYSGE